jgi:hypothetical protein
MKSDYVSRVAVTALLLAVSLTANSASAETLLLVCQRQPGNPGQPFQVTVDFSTKSVNVDGAVGRGNITDTTITVRLPMPGDPLGHQDISIDRATGVYAGRMCRLDRCSGTGYADCHKATRQF